MLPATLLLFLLRDVITGFKEATYVKATRRAAEWSPLIAVTFTTGPPFP